MASGGSDNPNELEIVSIGSLYRGPWDKKYWSCSRGKERYPYPVGYHAVRSHAGNVYGMEVREGQKGPLFIVTAADGSSFSGQTPDIAWGNLQKSCSKEKNSNVKRFSSKIDVAEIFGFKNPSVQRFLRELVNNVNMDEGKSLFPPFFCDEAMSFNDIPLQTSEKYAYLETAMEKQQISKRRRTKRRNSTEGACIPCHHNISKGDMFTPAINDNTTGPKIHKDSDIVSFGSCIRTEENLHSIHAGKTIHMGLDLSDCVVDKHIISQEKTNGVRHETSRLSPDLDNCYDSEKLLLDRCSDAEIEQINRSSSLSKGDITISALEHVNENSTCLKNNLIAVKSSLRPYKFHSVEAASRSDFKSLTRSEQCASEPTQSLPCKIVYSGCISEDNDFREVAKDSLPEIASSGSSGQNLEDGVDLLGQELALSMMGFLLPQAVPLIKKTYIRRRSRRRPNCNPSTERNSVDSNTSHHHDDVMCQEKLDQMSEMPVQVVMDSQKSLRQADSFCAVTACMVNDSFPENGSSNDTKSIVPDSLENDLFSYSISMQEYLYSDFDKCNLTNPNKLKGNCNFTSSSVAITQEFNKSSRCNIPNDAENSEAVAVDNYDGNAISNSFTDTMEPVDNIPRAEETIGESIKNMLRHLKNPTGNPSSSDASCGLQSSSQHFSDGPKNYAEEECAQVPGSSLGEAQKFEQNSPTLCLTINNLNDNEIPRKDCEIHGTFEFSKMKHRSPVEIISFDVRGKSKGETIREKNKHYFCMPNKLLPTEGLLLDTHEAQNFCRAPPSLMLNNAVLESPVSRHVNMSNASEKNFAMNSILTPAKDQARSMNHVVDSKMTVYKLGTEEQNNDLKEHQDVSEHGVKCLIPAVTGFQNRDMDKNIMETMEVPNQAYSCNKTCMNSVGQFSKIGQCSLPQVKDEIKQTLDQNRHSVYNLEHSDINPPFRTSIYSNEPVLRPLIKSSSKDLSYGQLYSRSFLDESSSKEASLNEGDQLMEIIGCYMHPLPVLYVMLNSMGNYLQVCVFCGFPDVTSRYVFMYSIFIQGQWSGRPSFLGYTSLQLPLVSSSWNNSIPFERSALQLASDGKSLIFVSSIKVPRCREQNINCFCSICMAESPKDVDLEIVHINFGFVSRITTLKTNGSIVCISICEPNYVVAVEDSGGLHVWVMNFKWSEYSEDFMLPNFDYESPMALELIRVPSCPLIIGHNCLSDLLLWDISKRVLLAKFSSPGSRIFQVVPVSLFNWQSNAGHERSRSPEHTKQTIQKANSKISSVSSEEIAVWILISVAMDSETVHEVQGLGPRPVGLWRLALMVNNMIIVGSIFDPRATAVCASADGGITGNSDGFSYKWELSSGRILANLPSTKCCVSCVSLDAQSGALAVGDIDGGLQVLMERR